MKTRRLAQGIAAVGMMLAAPAVAQETTQPAAAPAPASECELHIWPAERFQAMTTGLLSGFGVLGAVADSAAHAKKDDTNKAQLATALDPKGQVEALSQIDLVAALKLPPSRLVIHDVPLDRKTVNKIPTRRAQSTSPCYAEVIVADLFYHKAAIYGRSLQTLFIFRNFRAAQEKPYIYKGWGGNGLKLFPPKPNEDFEAAAAELVTVFKANFNEFARNAAAAKAR